ncbi:hypothetical protein B0H14DRAFT_2570186 [Mycena olivaceomarginata]|nr:hypothetical protein B0H14DRAFT_2570186 [Mycena olivaceomarginata]
MSRGPPDDFLHKYRPERHNWFFELAGLSGRTMSACFWYELTGSRTIHRYAAVRGLADGVRTVHGDGRLAMVMVSADCRAMRAGDRRWPRIGMQCGRVGEERERGQGAGRAVLLQCYTIPPDPKYLKASEVSGNSCV